MKNFTCVIPLDQTANAAANFRISVPIEGGTSLLINKKGSSTITDVAGNQIDSPDESHKLKNIQKEAATISEIATLLDPLWNITYTDNFVRCSTDPYLPGKLFSMVVEIDVNETLVENIESFLGCLLESTIAKKLVFNTLTGPELTKLIDVVRAAQLEAYYQLNGETVVVL